MTESDTSIIIDDDISVAESTRWSRQSIYKIPVSVKAQKERHYTPQMVSIGPYHHGTGSLPEMEEHKLRALRHFLKRSGKTLESLCQKLSPKVQDLKGAYDQLEKTQFNEDEKFLKLMVTDGCFILELLRTTTQQAGDGDSSNGYQWNDPIFSNHGWLNIVPYLKRDMLMLENQIPMEVLLELYLLDTCERNRIGLTIRILNFFDQKPGEQKNLNELSNSLHILDLYRKSLISYRSKNGTKKGHSKKGINSNSQDSPTSGIIQSATKLEESGITIKASKTKDLTKISFHRVCCGFSNGKLKIPPVAVNDAFESSYLNMIAFERFHVGTGHDVTSYIFFMDNLIDSVEDVKLLHSCGVIRNELGSDKAVARLFNSLSSESIIDQSSELGQVHKEVSDHCRKKRHHWRAYFWQRYCANPLVVIAVIAAILIFFLTIVQTICAILSYLKQVSP